MAGLVPVIQQALASVLRSEMLLDARNKSGHDVV